MSLTEIKTWLEYALKDDKLDELIVNIEGSSEKGSGYMGDIFFVSANGVGEDGSTKEYDLVLKCSKRSKALRESTPVKESFLNEIFVYEKILPAFSRFQKEKGVKDPFDGAAKCYGTITDEDKEVMVLENMKKRGYNLWPMMQPLNRNIIDVVIEQYAKFHSTSVAFERQKPKEFLTLLSKKNFSEMLVQMEDMEIMLGVPIQQSCEILKNDLDSNTLLKWSNFKNCINETCVDILEGTSGIKVILHGDCWNNNFLFSFQENTKVIFLDWDLSMYASPILDISYFLFSCISEEDIENLADILATYHKHFMSHLNQLGVTGEVYPLHEFMNDWQKYSKYGLMMAPLAIKLCTTKKDEIVDIAQGAEDGRVLSETFAKEITDTDAFKKRIRPIVKYAVKNELI